MGSFGQLMICITAVVSAAGGALALGGGSRPRAFEAGEKLLHAAAAAAATTLLVLVFLLLTYDYRVAYVRDYADRTMSTLYLAMAVWGGQEGGLLLWAVLQVWFTSAAACLIKGDIGRLKPAALGFLASLQVFLLLLVLFHSNPFEPLGTIAADGIGLNPLLRNPYMAIHPPTLYIGFVGFSIPMAFAIAALVEGKSDHRWLEDLRPWTLFAWVSLSAGNLLGMVWAYEELGWGGYWGWDPVENASFMPWLTATALVHTAVLSKAKRLFYPTSLVLILLTFVLVVFGTFLTRSGIIQSVHAFAGSTTGPYFLGLIAFVAVLFTALIAMRWKTLASLKTMETVVSPEGIFFMAVLAFVLSAVFVWLATMAPFFTELFKGEKVAVTPEFFNKWMAPAGLAIMALLGLCVLVGWRNPSFKALVGRAAIPGIGAAVACAAAFLLWNRNGGGWSKAHWISLICLALVGFAAAAIGRELIGLFRKAADEQSIGKSRKRRIGAQLVHLAIAALFVGFSGAAHTEEQSMSLQKGQTMQIGDYKIELKGLREESDFERHALLADLEVRRSDRSIGVLSPARHTYHSHPDKPTSEVVIRTLLTEDLFLILGSGDTSQGRAVIRAVVNPLVVWIWLGGALLIVGALVALFPSGWNRVPAGKLVKTACAILLIAAIGVGTGLAWDLTAAVAAFIGVGLALMLFGINAALKDLADEASKP